MEQFRFKNMKKFVLPQQLPKYLTTVTHLSMLIAVVLYVGTAGLFFWLGMRFGEVNQAARDDRLVQPVVEPAYPQTSTLPESSLLPTATPSAAPSPKIQSLQGAPRFFTGSVFAKPLATSLSYTKEPRITSIRPNLEAFSVPIYRVGKDTPLVKVFNDWGRTYQWPIPAAAQSSTGVDKHIAILDTNKNVIDEIWMMERQGDGTVKAGGMKDFPVSGDGISHPANQRVTASGFSAVAGTLVREDFLENGKFIQSPVIHHALTISIPHALLKKESFISPAVGGDAAGDNTGDIPVGAKFALPKDLDVDSLTVHPLVKSIARAAKDYGIYVTDRNDAKQYNGGYVGTVRVEVGVIQSVYGTSNDELATTIQKQMGDIIQKYGIYRVK
jgi:hypothetical protein